MVSKAATASNKVATVNNKAATASSREATVVNSQKATITASSNKDSTANITTSKVPKARLMASRHPAAQPTVKASSASRINHRRPTVSKEVKRTANSSNSHNSSRHPPPNLLLQPTTWTNKFSLSSAQGNPVEGDRGILGALGGGAAGGFAGHKAGGHGFLGAVGGAIMGSLAEDYAKDRKHSHQGGAGGSQGGYGGQSQSGGSGGLGSFFGGKN